MNTTKKKTRKPRQSLTFYRQRLWSVPVLAARVDEWVPHEDLREALGGRSLSGVLAGLRLIGDHTIRTRRQDRARVQVMLMSDMTAGIGKAADFPTERGERDHERTRFYERMRARFAA